MMRKNKQKFPKPEVIGEIPMVVIGGEVWGFEVSVLSKEEREAIKQEKGELDDRTGTNG